MGEAWNSDGGQLTPQRLTQSRHTHLDRRGERGVARATRASFVT